MLAFVGRVRANIHWVIVGVLALALAFAAGRFTAGKTKTETTTSTTASTSASTSTTTSTASADAQVITSTVVRVVYQNQATLQQARNTDCTEDFDPNTGRMVRRHCVTKSTSSSTSSSAGGSTASSSSSSTSSTDAQTVTSTSTASASTTTTVTTKTETTSATSAFLSSQGLHLTVSAELGLLDNLKPTLTTSYGVGLSKDLFGPLSIGVAASTDKVLLASLGLDLGKDWSASASAGVRWTDFTKPFYGGSLDRRILGPIWVGVWGYSDRSGGLSASVTLP